MDIVALGASVSILGMILFIALAFYSKAAATAQMRGRLEGVLAGATSVVEASGEVTALRPGLSVTGALRVVFSGAWLESAGTAAPDHHPLPCASMCGARYEAGMGVISLTSISSSSSLKMNSSPIGW